EYIGPFSKIANEITRQYYLDETTSVGQTHYYTVTAVYDSGESEFSNIIEIQTDAQGDGYTINSGWTTSNPALDGVICSSEWAQAVATDISYPGYSGTVTLYTMNNSNTLFIAVDDKRDLSLDHHDQLAVFFDEDRDREWPQSSPSTEGNFWFTWNADSGSAACSFAPRYGFWPNNLGCEMPQIPAGVKAKISSASGNVQYEAMINLNTSPLNASIIDSIGVLFYTYDNSSVDYNAFWPQGADELKLITPDTQSWGLAPFSYGSLVLASPAGATTISLNLKQGWNMISSNVDPLDPNIENLMAPVADKLVLMKNAAGQVYNPAYNINTIGTFNYQECYRVNMSGPDALPILGNLVAFDTPIQLPAGWSSITYLPEIPLDIETALTSIHSQLFVVKNNVGEAYIPPYGINQIGKMQPGQGYQVYLNAPGTLIYPTTSLAANEMSVAKSTEKASAKHFQFTSVTGENATIILPLTVEPKYSDGNLIETGDEVGIFNSSGICCGATVWEGCHTAITVWGDNSQTEAVDGFASGEALQFRLWRKSVDKEYPVTIECAESQSAVYEANGFALLSKFEALTTADVTGEDQAEIPTEFRLLQNYPNPFNPGTEIRYQLPQTSRVVLRIQNMLGQEVITLVNRNQSAGCHAVRWDAKDANGNDVSSGIYLYRIEAGEFVAQKKMLFIR
ncbi:T9SS type A sorting domain-containing protein, partial [candidate division KSB1 bacterium]|nr:T9SS type A sorting domain-containing protein [candidate division KSB1 bacterium]